MCLLARYVISRTALLLAVDKRIRIQRLKTRLINVVVCNEQQQDDFVTYIHSDSVAIVGLGFGFLRFLSFFVQPRQILYNTPRGRFDSHSASPMTIAIYLTHSIELVIITSKYSVKIACYVRQWLWHFPRQKAAWLQLAVCDDIMYAVRYFAFLFKQITPFYPPRTSY